MPMKPNSWRTTHAKLASGRTKVYYYTKPGGTRFFDVWDEPLSEPYPAAFVTAYERAIQNEQPKIEIGDFAKFVDAFLQSEAFRKLSPATQEGYQRDLLLARNKFGTLSVNAIEDRRFKGQVILWIESFAKTSPRRADLVAVALRRMFDHALKRGLLLINPAATVERNYIKKQDLRPWTRDEIDLFLTDCPQSTADTLNLALHTGLRRSDLATIGWDAWKGDHLLHRTSKSRKNRIVVVSLLPEGQLFLEELKARQAAGPLGLQRTILVGENGKSMLPASVGKKVNNRAKSLGLEQTLHRLRNNRCCLLINGALNDSEIAREMGWTLTDVAEMKEVYATREVIASARVAKLRLAASK